jgi:PAS domain S-box-containing protein
MQALQVLPSTRTQQDRAVSDRPGSGRNPGLILFRSATDLLRLAWDYSHDGLVFTDGNGTIVAANKAYAAMTGFREHELVGKPLTLAFSSQVSQDEALAEYRKNFESRSFPPYSEQQILLPTGRAIDVEISHSFVETEDGTGLLFSIFRDVTKRKEAERALAQSERNYHELFEHAVQGMFQTSLSGKLINANPALVRLLGYESFEELSRINLGELYVNPKDRERLVQLLLTQGFCRDVELRLRRKDGQVITVLEHSRIIRDHQGNPVMLEGILEDITERKAQEQQLREYVDALRVSQQTLAELNARKDKLLFALSHDLRSPLGSILGFAEILLEDGEQLPAEERRQFLQYIRDAAQNQLKVINELLRKPEEEPSEPEGQSDGTDLKQIAEKAVELLSTVAKQKLVTVEVDIPAGTMVRAKDQPVLQVLNNLISNALKFTPPNGRVRLDIAKQTAEEIVLAVRDTGIGIPLEDQDQLFVKRGGYTRTGLGGEKGTGLGLPLCAEIMKELGGKITVESTPGNGTAFYLHFPKASGEDRVNILVVDDDPGIRALHAKFIGKACPGAHILQAQDGRQALDLMQRYKPKLVLSDYAMPVMNGLAFLEAAKRQEELKQIPIVIATGHDSWAVREELIAAGAHDVLAKPLPQEKIRNILQATISTRSEIP